MPMFEELFKGDLQLFKMNFRTTTLLPKIEDAARIEQSFPICLLNVLSRFFYQSGYE